MAHVDHRRQSAVPDEQPADSVDRTLRRRQPDPQRALIAERLEPLEGEGQVGPPLVAGDRMDLVDDHRLDGAQRLPSPLAGHQQVQRLGGRHHEARRPADHQRPLGAGRVPGAHRHPDVGRRETELGRHRSDLGQRPLKIFGDVDGESPKRRHIDHPGPDRDVGAGLVGPIQGVDGDQEPGQRLARPGRGGDQGVPPGGDQGPAPGLWLGGTFGEAAQEPGGDGRVERGQVRVRRRGQAAVRRQDERRRRGQNHGHDGRPRV